MNKITFVLVILFPLLVFFNLKNKKIFDPTIFFLLLFGLIWLLKNFIISGCLIFPIPFLCFEIIEWSNFDLAVTEKMAGEAWSKGWPQQNNFKSYELFVSNYNWFETWISGHFFIILEKFLPILIFTIFFILIFLIYGKKIVKEEISFLRKKFVLFYIVSILNLLLWFHYFPIYRYGYGFLTLFTILSVFILFMNLLKKPNLKFIKRYYFIIILIGYAFFISKNIDRFLENYQKVYSTKPFPNISFSYYIEKNQKL